jgi:hypothetical protein
MLAATETTMPLPLDTATKLLVGCRFGKPLHYAPSHAAGFFKFLEDMGEDGTLEQSGSGHLARFGWTSADQVVHWNFDRTDLRVEVRTQVSAEMNDSLSELDAGFESMDFVEMRDRLSGLAQDYLEKGLAALGVDGVKRLGLVLELELSRARFWELSAPGLLVASGLRSGEVMDSAFQVKFEIDKTESLSRRINVTYTTQQVNTGQIGRAWNTELESVDVLAVDYQELYEEPVNSGHNRADRRKRGHSIEDAYRTAIHRAEEVWRGLY